jgi:radical SAM superfamily enzyme YgiQ (UPF0313 family)
MDFVIKMILDTGSKVVGFSVLSPTIHFTGELARRIKQVSPETLVIFGGHQVSTFYEGRRVLETENIDAVVSHEGDLTLTRMMEDLDNHGKFLPTPGLMYKENGEIIDGGLPEPVTSLDDLPFADYSDFDLSVYRDPQQLYIFSSRGCINQCHFCNERNYFGRYRFRSGKSLFDEVAYRVRSGARRFYFSDSIVNGSIPALTEFCELVVQNNISIDWGGQGVIRKEMTPEMMRLMKRAGCYMFAYGLETGSDKTREAMNKKLFNMDMAADVLKATAEAGINCCPFFMVGYPTETEQDFQETLDFIRRNRPYIAAVAVSPTGVVIMPQTRISNHPDEFGVEPNPHHIYWSTIDGTNTYPVRMDRYERFCKLCIELGIPGGGVLAEKPDKLAAMDRYEEYRAGVDGCVSCQ